MAQCGYYNVRTPVMEESGTAFPAGAEGDWYAENFQILKGF